MGIAVPARLSNLAWLWLTTVVVILDQWTKWLITSRFELYEVMPVTGWFNLVLAHNTGAAFSFLSDHSGWQRWFFITLTVIVSIGLLVWLLRVPAKGAWRLRLGILLVLGGAIGNLIDRVRFGYVVDFLDVHAGGWHWPAFNVADAAICCGVALLLLDSLFSDDNKNRA